MLLFELVDVSDHIGEGFGTSEFDVGEEVPEQGFEFRHADHFALELGFPADGMEGFGGAGVGVDGEGDLERQVGGEFDHGFGEGEVAVGFAEFFDGFEDVLELREFVGEGEAMKADSSFGLKLF
jgi:hypothetical protein